MNNKDEYIIEDNGINLIFKKNGLNHREAGPAIIWKTCTDKYPNAEEQKLYKTVIKDLKIEKKDFLHISNFTTHIIRSTYYLEGQHYTEEEFYKRKAKLDLKNELCKDLPITDSDTRRTKV
jgi:hypothetical protein